MRVARRHRDVLGESAIPLRAEVPAALQVAGGVPGAQPRVHEHAPAEKALAHPGRHRRHPPAHVRPLDARKLKPRQPAATQALLAAVAGADAPAGEYQPMRVSTSVLLTPKAPSPGPGGALDRPLRRPGARKGSHTDRARIARSWVRDARAGPHSPSGASTPRHASPTERRRASPGASAQAPRSRRPARWPAPGRACPPTPGSAGTATLELARPRALGHPAGGQAAGADRDSPAGGPDPV